MTDCMQPTSRRELEPWRGGSRASSSLLSMGRLHRQMAEAKARYVKQMRALYAEVYAPLRDMPTMKELRP
jgi:hypothetical protein